MTNLLLNHVKTNLKQIVSKTLDFIKKYRLFCKICIYKNNFCLQNVALTIRVADPDGNDPYPVPTYEKKKKKDPTVRKNLIWIQTSTNNPA